ncbi:hypothetical protein CONCODRAFT_12351 [Conidiobolus coronatus NRRL 28638]|uniref:Uncharacterized protein n=1 Tax=Conidiobolus coronatus (strain ATCC 28846 / CBS 209.66 / NRRL 28638) TaxID=796925 RepID=A0A137NTC0_CONC2|nr:hypothetical protein CONCODRAFT_12351 [Conidiobolus coronatus NRRL 28638]|eukprot:KXN65928.1 hypothetical protein CONCODRAFT_12351 [Conidiobolus coronatus NRRL 28638]
MNIGMTNQRKAKKLYAINLKTYTYQGFLNISGEDSKSKFSGLPSWTLAISVLSSMLLIILLIAVTWLYLRYKKRFKLDDTNSEKELYELWASTYRENKGIKLRDPYISRKNTRNTGGLNDTILFDGSIVNYECFQYEIDLEDLEITKTKT